MGRLPLHETVLSDWNMEVLNNTQTHLEIGKGGWKSRDNVALHKQLSAREHGAFATEMVK